MEESLKAALELGRDGNLLESNRLLEELVLQHPEHAMLHYECARSYDILAKEGEAISLYQRALELGLPKKETVNAYAQLGSLYRLGGQLTESEKILMEGMLRFWDVGLLKAFYAFTMYDLGNPGEAMRWMTHALLDSAEDKEIFLNQRVIRYLGSNLDVQNIMKSLVSNVHNEVEHPEGGKTIVEKVEAVLKVFEPTYFHGAWVFEFDRYDLHFADSNDETRRAAVAAFAIMVGIWETGSAQSFMPQHERKYTGDYNPLEPHFELNGYISAFYSNFNILQQEFPIITAYTVDSLGAIDERSKFGLDQEFPEIDPILFGKFRQEILLPNRQLKKKLPPFDDFLEEIGWDLSYRTW
ncbi:MAG TPA: tetratricopeptide repeat protein [Planococcus sp. (in: firmicutes)]|nr:tetratricopeptide repeat protein [Planococcus sp. (in: firmicutes)]